MISAKKFQLGHWDNEKGKRVIFPLHESKIFNSEEQLKQENKACYNPYGGKEHIWLTDEEIRSYEVINS